MKWLARIRGGLPFALTLPSCNAFDAPTEGVPSAFFQTSSAGTAALVGIAPTMATTVGQAGQAGVGGTGGASSGGMGGASSGGMGGASSGGMGGASSGGMGSADAVPMPPGGGAPGLPRPPAWLPEPPDAAIQNTADGGSPLPDAAIDGG